MEISSLMRRDNTEVTGKWQLSEEDFEAVIINMLQ